MWPIYDRVHRVKVGTRSLRGGPHAYLYIPLESRLRPFHDNSGPVNFLPQIVRNLHRIVTRGSESTFQWDTQICVRSSTETAGSLRNPETRRTPSFVIVHFIYTKTAIAIAICRNENSLGKVCFGKAV